MQAILENLFDYIKITIQGAVYYTVVGADAHIGPAERADFMVIFGEFVTSSRADVGIGPYSQGGKYNTNSPENFRSSLLPAARPLSQLC